MVDVRLICEDCGVKWFVPHDGDAVDEATPCAGCGGRLLPFEAADGREAPRWTGAIEAARRP